MIDTLQSWIKEKGGNLNNIEIKFDEYRKPRLFAAKTIAKGESALSIPIECLLFDSMYNEDPAIRKAQQTLDKEVVLAFILLKELNNKTSAFRNLLRSFPAQYQRFPFFFNKIDFEFARGTTIPCILSFMNISR